MWLFVCRELSLECEFQIWCVDASWDGGVSHTISVTVTLTSELVFRIIMSEA